MIYRTLFFISLLLLGSAHAAEHSSDAWFGFFNKTTLNETVSLWTETQLRYDINSQSMQQTLVRTGPLFDLGHYELGILYAYIDSDNSKEHRLALQHVINYGEFFRSLFSHRIRLEYRYREGATNLPERFRYALRAQGNSSRRFNHVIWDEVFLNLRKSAAIQSETFDRNRLFIGGRYTVNNNMAVEAGYLNQYVPRPQQQNLFEHILTLYLVFTT